MAPEDFFLLVAHATGKEKVFLLAHPEYALTGEEEAKAEQYLKRRLKHEPVAYIVGHKEFYDRDFLVTRDTLIPRPETELLIESALNAISNFPWPRPATAGRQPPISKDIDIVDIGTGSGNIIITLAKEIEKAYPTSGMKYYALDVSPRALAVARDNATHHHINTRITFLESDLLKNFSWVQKENHHLIVTANLPYLSEDIYQGSDTDVRDYEPSSALVSGHDGLDHYRRLLTELKELERHTHTTIFLEISPEQTQKLTKEIEDVFPQAALLVFQDLSGRDRLIQATF